MTVLVAKRDGVLTVTIDRPEVRNAVAIGLVNRLVRAGEALRPGGERGPAGRPGGERAS